MRIALLTDAEGNPHPQNLSEVVVAGLVLVSEDGVAGATMVLKANWVQSRLPSLLCLGEVCLKLCKSITCTDMSDWSNCQPQIYFLSSIAGPELC